MHQYRSPSNKARYKRYVQSTLRYAGGKSLATGFIVDLLPNNIKRVISPFFGGGSFEIACSKELGLEVIGYDIFELLTNYWNVQINAPQELYCRLKKYSPTRNGFNEIKQVMKKHWTKEKIIRSKYELAALFYFNHNTSYGPHFLGWPSSVYLQEKKYEALIQKVKNFKAGNLSVFCDTFENVIQKHSNDFLYCDPPYYLDGDSKTFVGLYPHRNFPMYHANFQHETLRDLLHNHKGGFVLSYNDCSTIREWYKDFSVTCPSWQYTLSQGDTRIGKNRTDNNNGSHIKKSHELLIYKYAE